MLNQPVNRKQDTGLRYRSRSTQELQEINNHETLMTQMANEEHTFQPDQSDQQNITERENKIYQPTNKDDLRIELRLAIQKNNTRFLKGQVLPLSEKNTQLKDQILALTYYMQERRKDFASLLKNYDLDGKSRELEMNIGDLNEIYKDLKNDIQYELKQKQEFQKMTGELKEKIKNDLIESNLRTEEQQQLIQLQQNKFDQIIQVKENNIAQIDEKLVKQIKDNQQLRFTIDNSDSLQAQEINNKINEIISLNQTIDDLKNNHQIERTQAKVEQDSQMNLQKQMYLKQIADMKRDLNDQTVKSDTQIKKLMSQIQQIRQELQALNQKNNNTQQVSDKANYKLDNQITQNKKLREEFIQARQTIETEVLKMNELTALNVKLQKEKDDSNKKNSTLLSDISLWKEINRKQEREIAHQKKLLVDEKSKIETTIQEMQNIIQKNDTLWRKKISQSKQKYESFILQMKTDVKILNQYYQYQQKLAQQQQKQKQEQEQQHRAVEVHQNTNTFDIKPPSLRIINTVPDNIILTKEALVNVEIQNKEIDFIKINQQQIDQQDKNLLKQMNIKQQQLEKQLERETLLQERNLKIIKELIQKNYELNDQLQQVSKEFMDSQMVQSIKKSVQRVKISGDYKITEIVQQNENEQQFQIIRTKKKIQQKDIVRTQKSTVIKKLNSENFNNKSSDLIQIQDTENEIPNQLSVNSENPQQNQIDTKKQLKVKSKFQVSKISQSNQTTFENPNQLDQKSQQISANQSETDQKQTEQDEQATQMKQNIEDSVEEQDEESENQDSMDLEEKQSDQDEYTKRLFEELKQKFLVVQEEEEEEKNSFEFLEIYQTFDMSTQYDDPVQIAYIQKLEATKLELEKQLVDKERQQKLNQKKLADDFEQRKKVMMKEYALQVKSTQEKAEQHMNSQLNEQKNRLDKQITVLVEREKEIQKELQYLDLTLNGKIKMLEREMEKLIEERDRLNKLYQGLLFEKQQIELMFKQEKRTNEDVSMELDAKIALYKQTQQAEVISLNRQLADSIKLQGEMKKAYDDLSQDYKLVENLKKEAIAKCRLLNIQIMTTTKTCEEQEKQISHHTEQLKYLSLELENSKQVYNIFQNKNQHRMNILSLDNIQSEGQKSNINRVQQVLNIKAEGQKANQNRGIVVSQQQINRKQRVLFICQYLQDISQQFTININMNPQNKRADSKQSRKIQINSSQPMINEKQSDMKLQLPKVRVMSSFQEVMFENLDADQNLSQNQLWNPAFGKENS